MYPGLTLPLLGVVALAAILIAVVSVRQPVLRWLAFRQVTRRRTEALLVITGSMLGTAIIVGALVVGDTLNFSVRQDAYRTLGPIDERVVATSTDSAHQVHQTLEHAIGSSSQIDGLLNTRVAQAAAVSTANGERLAEPAVLAWDLNFSEAETFGASGSPSGLGGATPSPGELVVNEVFADALKVDPGDPVSLLLAGQTRTYTIDRIVAEEGLAGAGLGSSRNLDVFVPTGSLSDRTAGTEIRNVTLVSNTGDVETGNDLTPIVTQEITRALSSTPGVSVETPKDDVLTSAKEVGDSLGALFLMIGSFSIIAGALLLVNIFVMLAEERKSQLGMLRAAGLKRSRLVAAFTLEGAIYALAATLVGVGLGVLVGRGVAYLAAKIFSGWSQDGAGLDVTFAVTPTSLINGACLGLVIALSTILATSIRISRFNIIAAIRDSEQQSGSRQRRRLVVSSTALAVILAVAAVPAVVTSSPVGTFLLPALAMLCLTPMLSRRLGKHKAYSGVATAVLVWTLVANLVRPDLYDTPSMAVYVVLGSLLAFSSVALLSENQHVVLRPFRRWIARPSEEGLATRLAVSYPVTKRFRTGATLIMYTLITLVLMLLAEIGGVLTQSVDSQVASATAGYSIRVDFNAQQPPNSLLRDGSQQRTSSDITEATPLIVAPARATDPGGRTTDSLSTVVTGVPRHSLESMQFTDRLVGLNSDRAVWQAMQTDSRYVAIDPFFGASGGPGGEYYRPGDTFQITDPESGKTTTKVIAGILQNATMFYSPTTPAAFPAVMSRDAALALFDRDVKASAALLRTADGIDDDSLATELQGEYLASSLVATPVESTVRRMFDANLSFFRLMQGFLAIGLLVGITGLGVVMVRAVRERRRTIGVLRALGFRARTIQRSFLVESGFVALEGIMLGSVLGILTTWLMYQKSAAFDGIQSGYPVMWATALVMGIITLVASIVATFGPARRAAQIQPALATRVAE